MDVLPRVVDMTCTPEADINMFRAYSAKANNKVVIVNAA